MLHTDRLLKRPRTADANTSNGRGSKRRRFPHGSGGHQEPQSPTGDALSVKGQTHTQKKSLHKRWSVSYPTGGHYMDLDPVISSDEQ